MLAVKRAKHELDRSPRVPASPLLHIQLAHFVGNLHQYCLDGILLGATSAFKARLAAADTLDAAPEKRKEFMNPKNIKSVDLFMFSGFIKSLCFSSLDCRQQPAIVLSPALLYGHLCSCSTVTGAPPVLSPVLLYCHLCACTITCAPVLSPVRLYCHLCAPALSPEHQWRLAHDGFRLQREAHEAYLRAAADTCFLLNTALSVAIARRVYAILALVLKYCRLCRELLQRGPHHRYAILALVLKYCRLCRELLQRGPHH
eukprot:1192835-Prorocentrum_minimum.AAC.1